MALEARRAAKVHCTPDDEIPSIMAHLANEIVGRYRFAQVPRNVSAQLRLLGTLALSKPVSWKFS